MGWTSYKADYYKKGTVDRKEEINKNVIRSEKIRVLKSAMKGSTYYAAIEDIESNQVFAVVILTSVNMKDYCNFSYKDMDETMGPYYYDCPKSILDLLTPTDNESANEWRKKCYENLRKKNDKNSLKNLPIGTRIKVTMPCDSCRYNQGDKVILEKERKLSSNRTAWVVTNRNVYFASSLMKRLEDRGCYEIL